ncbi:tetratricopeptide repeat-containing sulfotransferase family protein [Elongatibacter sediminis]|uniref:Sulfotransferase n=1 Tax=Elongatibacter sediminis TaxID=3119006 RepID=A0AAW9RLY5_9GAMM
MNRTYATKSTLFEAVELINNGQIDQAETLCRAAVRRNERDVNMTALLGATLFKARRIDEAEHWLRHTIELAPNFAKPWTDLGQLLLTTQRPAEAVEALEKAVGLDASDADAWFHLGKARALTGRGPEADQAFERSFELDPERKALAHAAEHQQQGRLGEAEKIYRDLLRHNPDNVNALRLLGTLAAHAGRMGEAERLFRRAIARAPDFFEARLDLGRILKEQQRLEEAIEHIEKATRLEPTHHQAWFLLASTLAPAARTEDSVRAYRRVIDLRPRHAGAWLGLGHTLKTLGSQQEAIAAYRECIRLKPGQGETYWSLANLKTYRLTDEDIQDMEFQLARNAVGGESENRPAVDRDDRQDEPPGTQSRVNFLFALAKAWEDRGDYERAWTCYREGNETQRMAENYDPVRTEVLNDEIISVFDAEFLQDQGGHGHPAPDPIFIVGLPRSGSTLLEQILASHSEVEGTAELPYIGIVANGVGTGRADGLNYPRAIRDIDREQLRQLGQQYLDRARIHRTESRPRFIDKMPNNFPAIGLLHLILPNAKIIDARRYPLDSCLSCYRQLFARGQSFTYDLTDIGEYFLQYQRMMDYWHEVLPGRVLTVQYEDLVTDFESQVNRLLDYCELPREDGPYRFWETDRPVRTASSEQVRQPIYSGSIHRWRRYRHHLDELMEVLEPALPRYARYESINRD